MKIELRRILILLLAVALVGPLGCKQSSLEPQPPTQPSPPPPGPALPDMQAEYQKALVKAPIFAAMPDDVLTASNRRDGIGLGLKASSLSYPAGAPIILHMVYENIDAGKPIASGMCRYVSVNVEDVDHQQLSMAQYTAPPCRKDSFYKNEVPLPKGKPMTLDIDLKSLSVYPADPGHYVVNVSWQSVIAGKETYLWGPVYSSLGSNALPILITP